MLLDAVDVYTPTAPHHPSTMPFFTLYTLIFAHDTGRR